MASSLLFWKDVCPSNFSVGLFYRNFFALPYVHERRARNDVVVTLMVAGNNIFSNTALCCVITQKLDAKLTDSARLKIAKNMFHIGNFLISIVTDYSKKADVWADFNSDSTQRPFKSERKFYKKLQSIYGGRLLEFRWIAKRSITITRTILL